MKARRLHFQCFAEARKVKLVSFPVDHDAHCRALVMLAHHDDTMLKAAIVDMGAGEEKLALQAGGSPKACRIMQRITFLACIFSRRHYLH